MLLTTQEMVCYFADGFRYQICRPFSCGFYQIWGMVGGAGGVDGSGGGGVRQDVKSVVKW